MQSIFIEDLELKTIIGVYESERQSPQTLVFNIEIGLPHSRAFHSDSLSDTIDYAAVAELIRIELGSHPFHLLERLAQHLCEHIEMRFDVSMIRMRVAKGTIVPGAKRVGVMIERRIAGNVALYEAGSVAASEDADAAGCSAGSSNVSAAGIPALTPLR